MNRRTSDPGRRTSQLLAATVVTALCLLVLAASALAGAQEPTKGPIPDEAFRAGGQPLDLSIVPDFVPALGRDGEHVGYVAKQALADPVIGEDGRVLSAPIAVVGEDLVTIVGYMYPSKGFVPAGVDPETVPEIPAELVPAP